MNLSFLSPLGISSSLAAALLLGSAALLALLYFLRVSPQKQVVPFLAMWKKAIGLRPSRLRNLFRLLSFLLALLIVSLLTVSLWKPFWKVEKSKHHYVLLIDASASMQAVLPEGKTRFQQAKEQAQAFAATLSEQDAALVIAIQETPRVIGGFSLGPFGLREQMKQIEVADTQADLTAALQLGQIYLQGKEQPSMILFSDGGFSQEELNRLPLATTENPIPLLFQPVTTIPQTKGNVAITAFSARKYHQNRLQYEVFLKIHSFPSHPKNAFVPIEAEITQLPVRKSFSVEILQDGKLIETESLSLAEGETMERTYRKLAGYGAKLEARLVFPKGEEDLLPLDNHAFAILPELHQQKVILVTEGNLFLEGALLAISSGEENQIIFEKQTPAQYEAASKTLEKQQSLSGKVFIFDSYTPQILPKNHAFYLNPQGTSSPFAIKERIKAPILTDVNSKHPLARFLAVKDINISTSSVFVVNKQDQVIASMLGKPILVARENQGNLAGTPFAYKQVALGFDIKKSDLPLRVTFPLLLLNTLDWFRSDGVEVQSYATGQNAWISVDALLHQYQPQNTPLSSGQVSLPQSISLLTPTGNKVALPILGGNAFFHPQSTGFYELAFPENPLSTQKPILLAANLQDEWESQAITQAELTIRHQPIPLAPKPKLIENGIPLWFKLILGVVAILLGEWWLYHRRWIV